MSSYLQRIRDNKKYSIDYSTHGIFIILTQIMMIVNISFYNYTNVMIISQLLPMALLAILVLRSGDIDKCFFRYIQWWGGFILICVLSVLWGKNPDSFIQQIIAVFQCAVVGCVVMASAIEKENHDRLIKTILIAGLVLVARLFVQVPYSAWGTERVGTYIGYGNNRAGINLSFCSIFAIYMMYKHKHKAYILLCLLFIAMTILTGSKKSLLGILIGMSIMIIASSGSSKTKWKNICISLIAIGVVYYCIMHIQVLYEAIGKRFEALVSTLSEEDSWKHSQSSSASRIYLINQAWDTFLQYPILGVGLNGFASFNSLSAYAHNNYLELLCDLGIVGFIAYYSFWIRNITISIKAIRHNNTGDRINILIKLAILIYMLVIDIGLVSFPIEPTHIAIALAVAIGNTELQTDSLNRYCKYFK